MKQSKTGKMVKNKPEWEVKVTNDSPCFFTETALSCVGFQSVTPIASSVVSKSGNTCLLDGGQALHDFSFKYVWDTSFDLKIIAGSIACSWIFYPNWSGLALLKISHLDICNWWFLALNKIIVQFICLRLIKINNYLSFAN